MKTYDNYKDSGVEWIGEIPEFWEVKELKYVVNCNQTSLREDTPTDFLLEYIDISSVNSDGKIIETQELSFKDSPSRARRIIKQGNVLISTVRTYLKAIAQIKVNRRNLIASTGFAVLEAKDNLNSNFLYYYSRSEKFVDVICANSKGVSYPSITSTELLNLKICLPSIAEQTQIAQYLDHKTSQIDKLITDKEKLIELLNEERTAIINQAVTKGLNPEAPMKDSGIEWLGEVPEHWKVKRMKYLCDIGTGEKDTENREESGLYPFYVRSQTVERISTYSFDGEAILTAGDGVGVCKVWHYVNEKFDYHQRVYRMSDFEGILGKFLFHYLKENFEKEVKKLSAKSTVDSLRRPMFQNFPVTYPSINEQREIIKYIEGEENRILNLLQTIEQEIEFLKEYKTALISEVVTGKVDVRDEDILKPAALA